MKQPNIAFALQMTKDYLDGKIDALTYRLDFPHEVEIRYEKMVRENPMMAELIFDCLVEDGAFLYHDLPALRSSKPKSGSSMSLWMMLIMGAWTCYSGRYEFSGHRRQGARKRAFRAWNP